MAQDKQTDNINKLWRGLEKLHALITLAEQVGRDIDLKLFDSTNGYGKGELTCILLDLGDLNDQAERLKNNVLNLWKQKVNEWRHKVNKSTQQ